MEVDDIPLRDTVDFLKNTYDDLMIDFLINSNCIMLNGRNDCSNDYFTSVSTKGLAVVDYAIVSHEFLHRCDNFNVLRALKCSCNHNWWDNVIQTIIYQVMLKKYS